MRMLILSAAIFAALLTCGCSAPPVTAQKTQQALTHAEYVTSVLEHHGLDLLVPYEEGPVLFLAQSGWGEISDPSFALLSELKSTPIYWGSHREHGGSCSFAEQEAGCGTDCYHGGMGYCCDCDEWCQCPDVGPPPPSGPPSDPPAPPNCEGPDLTGTWCGTGADFAEYLECCGWCGCDVAGCQYLCSDEDCPENDHPPWPYHAP